MRVLARAGQELFAYESILRDRGYHYVRRPETGMVMVRGRMGGDGAPFNLGEMTVTRCVIQLDDGSTGYSYVTGRSVRQAELAAIADALLQGAETARWHETLIAPLKASQDACFARRNTQAQATRVEFTTMLRGEG